MTEFSFLISSSFPTKHEESCLITISSNKTNLNAFEIRQKINVVAKT